jgi:S-adenosyl methyltransferase
MRTATRVESAREVSSEHSPQSDSADIQSHRAGESVGTTTQDLDLTRAHIGRVVNYFLGGDRHWAIDQAVAGAATEICLKLPDLFREDRRFRAHAIDLLWARRIRHFIDLGSGPPIKPMTHEVIDGYNRSDQHCWLSQRTGAQVDKTSHLVTASPSQE